jgi:hypothetical protein
MEDHANPNALGVIFRVANRIGADKGQPLSVKLDLWEGVE